jgi:hypothetical protein
MKERTYARNLPKGPSGSRDGYKCIYGLPTQFTTEVVRDSINYFVGRDRRFRRCEASGSLFEYTGAMLLNQFPYLRFNYPSTRWDEKNGYRGPVPDIQIENVGSLCVPPNLITKRTQFGVSDFDIETARDEALASMYAGTPKARPNFLRALIELKDLRASARGLADFFRWGNAAIRRAHTVFLWDGKTFRKTTRWVHECGGAINQMASLYLNAQFGILPTWQDVDLFLDKLREGMKVFGRDQRGVKALLDEGQVITSHYHVRDRSLPGILHGTIKGSILKGGPLWVASQNPAPTQTSGKTWTAATPFLKEVHRYGILQSREVEGCIFQKLKPLAEQSAYWKENWGNVGSTWSYPVITTAWDVLPWSWLVGWFTEAHRKIRKAERLARSYWMRAGFVGTPWISEKVSSVFYWPDFDYDYELYWPSSRVGVDGKPRAGYQGAYNAYCTQPDIRYRINRRYVVGKRAYTYRRLPLSEAPKQAHASVHAKVPVFRISIGMALIAQAALSGRKLDQVNRTLRRERPLARSNPPADKARNARKPVSPRKSFSEAFDEYIASSGRSLYETRRRK